MIIYHNTYYEKPMQRKVTTHFSPSRKLSEGNNSMKIFVIEFVMKKVLFNAAWNELLYPIIIKVKIY